jgi:hypothetical protein
MLPKVLRWPIIHSRICYHMKNYHLGRHGASCTSPFRILRYFWNLEGRINCLMKARPGLPYKLSWGPCRRDGPFQ